MLEENAVAPPMLFADYLCGTTLTAAPKRRDGEISLVCALGLESIFPGLILQWEYQLLSRTDEAILCAAFFAIMPIAIRAQDHLRVTAWPS